MSKTFKKTLSIILTVLMLISCVSFAVSAEETLEIKAGETISVDAPARFDENGYTTDNYTYVRFIPAVSGTYILTSASTESDPRCDLCDEALNVILDNNDNEIIADDNYVYSGNDYNFELSYTFEAGKVYYFALSDYDGDFTWDITLTCDHLFAGNVCSICKFECDHTEIDAVGSCVCGKVYDGIEIKADETITVETAARFDENDELTNDYTYVRFIPAVSGTYILTSASTESDPRCDLCAFKLNFIRDDIGSDIYADDGYTYNGNDMNFELSYTFEAGKIYYFALSDYDGDSTWDITLRTAPYVDENENEHEVTVDYGKNATCTEDGVTAGLYCTDCDAYMAGHETIAATGHKDENADGKCDNCDYVYPVANACDYCGRVHPTFIQELFCKITQFFVTLFTFLGLW